MVERWMVFTITGSHFTLLHATHTTFLTSQPVIADPLLKSCFVLPIAFLQPAAALLGSRKLGVEAGSLFLWERNGWGLQIKDQLRAH